MAAVEIESRDHASDATPPASPAVAASPAATQTMQTKKQNGQWRQYSVFPLFIIAASLFGFSVFSTVSPTYLHSLPFMNPYPSAAQPCEMSYFFLHHRHVPLTRLTPLSEQILAGSLEFNSSSSVVPSTPALSASIRRNSEFDEDEEAELLDSLERAEQAAEKKSDDKTDSERNKSRRSEFASFASVFLSSLPSELAPKNSSSRYRLMQYVPQGSTGRASNSSPRVPVLFLPGNSGSYHQLRSLASRLATLYADERKETNSHPPADRNDYYSIDFLEESSAFNGRLLWRQAWFANEALAHILSLYPNDTKAILVAHSMGGIVARAMTKLGNFPTATHAGGEQVTSAAGRIELIMTLGSPHRAPVIMVDEWMKKLYRVISHKPTESSTGPLSYLYPLLSASSSSSSSDFLFLSVNGGERDFQVESVLGGLDGLIDPTRGFSINTHTIGHGRLRSSGGIGALASGGRSGSEIESVDHQCLCWCKQLMETSAHSIKRVTERIIAGRKPDTSEGESRLAALKELWLPSPLAELRRLALAPTATRTTTTERDSTPLPTWRVLDSEYIAAASSKTAPGRISIPLGALNAARVPEGILFVWTGLMATVTVCRQDESPAGEPAVCVDLSRRAHLVAPELHPDHIAMSHAQRESNRIGLASTYMMHLTQSDLAMLLTHADTQSHVLHLTLSNGSREFFSRVRPLRNAVRRVWSYGFSYSRVDVATGDSLPPLPNRPAVYRSLESIPAGIERHIALTVTANADRTPNEQPLPTIIAITTLIKDTHTSTITATTKDQPIDTTQVDYAEQLFTFYPPSVDSPSSTHTRTIHVYRSGFDRQLVTLLIRIPQLDGADDDARVSDATLDVAIDSHGFISFLYTLYLQLPMLPQVILGVACLIFGLQHEYLRKYAEFPRIYQLFIWHTSHDDSGRSSSVMRILHSLAQSSLVWCMVFLSALAGAFFHGSLGWANDPLTGAAQSTDNAEDGAQSATITGIILSGWSLSRSPFSLIGLAGLILIFTCIAIILIVDATIFQCFRILSWLAHTACRCAQSIAGNTAVTTPAAGGVTQPRATILRRATIIVWIGVFIIATIFTVSLSLFALHSLAGFGLLDFLRSMCDQLVAWLSTFGMIFGLLSEHIYFERDVVGWLTAYATIASDISIHALTLALSAVCFLLHAATFPSLAGVPVGSANHRARLSARAYKSSMMTITVVILAILIMPGILSSMRLDAEQVDHAWLPTGANTAITMFQPAQAAKVYDASIATPRVTVGVDGRLTSSASSAVFVYPFVLTSLVDSPSLLALGWVTLALWCMFHVPFSPPILQSALLTAYGLSLIFVHGPAVALANMWWIAAMIAVCMAPHAMASGLYIINIMMDFMEGREGNYELAYEQEKQMYYQQQQQQQQQQQPRSAPSGSSRDKKNR